MEETAFAITLLSPDFIEDCNRVGYIPQLFQVLESVQGPNPFKLTCKITSPFLSPDLYGKAVKMTINQEMQDDLSVKVNITFKEAP